MKLEILGPVFPGADTTNDHHRIKCKLCSHIFKATPKSKKQNFNRWGAAGCPNCTRSANDTPKKRSVVERLEDMGVVLVEDYKNNKTETLMYNDNCCKREFRARPANVLAGKTICPPCNTEKKSKKMRKLNESRVSQRN